MKFFLFIILLLFIYPTKPFFFSEFSFVILFLFLFYVGIKYNFFYKELSQKKILLLYVILSFTLVINCLSMFLNNNFIDFTYYLLVVKYLIIILLSISINMYFIKNNFTAQNIIYLYVLASFLLSLFCIVEFFIPEAKIFMAKVFLSTDNIIYDSSFRVKGFVSGGGANLSWGLASAVMLSHAMYFKEKNLSLFYMSIVISIGTILVGRTGIILMLPSWILTFILLFNFRYFLKNLVNILSLSFITMITIFFINQNEEISKIIWRYSFEIFYNYIESGEIKSSSTDHLASMYFIPNVFHFIFGEGLYAENISYNPIDVGYFRQLLSIGFFGSLLIYSMFLFVQLKIYDYYKFYFHKSFLFLFLFSFWLFEFKESGFLKGYTSRLLILMYVYIVLIKLYKKGNIYFEK